MSAQAPAAPLAGFAAAVRAGLTREPQKELPCSYLYDEVGTALFQVITVLPEYGLTRADERLLEGNATALARALRPPVIVAELGSGSGRKTRPVLEALARTAPVMYYPIDISAAALAQCRFELSTLAGVGIVPLEKRYLEGLLEAASLRRRETLLVLFLGSTIGNFERPAAEQFLSDVRGVLRPGDALLLGADLVKAVERMRLAYDDPIGVTAAFNLNLLARINRELGADFALDRFRHEARWKERERRIEMHLVSTCAQTVTIPAAGLALPFTSGETIWTESCHKFSAEELPRMAARAGWAPEAQWVDSEWAFAENLWIAR
jgi:dimethylhistidine N-methyltransferase